MCCEQYDHKNDFNDGKTRTFKGETTANYDSDDSHNVTIHVMVATWLLLCCNRRHIVRTNHLKKAPEHRP